MDNDIHFRHFKSHGDLKFFPEDFGKSEIFEFSKIAIDEIEDLN